MTAYSVIIAMLCVAAIACLVIAVYHRLEVMDLRERLEGYRNENLRLKRERAVIRPLTTAELSALARRFCGTCSGTGIDAKKHKHCDCVKAKLDARIESGDVTMRDGRPYIVEALVEKKAA